MRFAWGFAGVDHAPRQDNLPAVIFASISTLESAGIQDSGNSTRS